MIKKLSLLFILFAIWGYVHMPYISKVSVSGTTYDIKDATARTTVEQIVFEENLDLIDHSGYVSGQGYCHYPLIMEIPAGTYTVFVPQRTTTPSTGYVWVALSSSVDTMTGSERVGIFHEPAGTTSITFTISQPARSIWFQAAGTFEASAPYEITVSGVSLRKSNAGSGIRLTSTNDTTNRSTDINYALSSYGFCQLSKGEYYVNSPIIMPDGTSIIGAGDSTKIIYTGTNGSAISMGSSCLVRDVTILKGKTDINVSTWPFSSTADASAANIWPEATTIDVSDSGFRHMVLSQPIPAGSYKFTATITRPSGSTDPYIAFSNATDGKVGDSNIIGKYYIKSIGSAYTVVVNLTEPAYSVRITSTENANSGITSVWSNIKLSASASQTAGITWSGSGKKCGVISGCRIAHFSYGGIWLYDTGTGVATGLSISDCHIYNCGCGIMIEKDAEYNKITGCSITGNYYGILNRGGNNKIGTCGIDGNVVGIQIDSDLGSNNGHGSISNCTVNHSGSNTGYGLIIKDTGRMLIDNCNFYFSKIKLEHTGGNTFSNCGFGSSAGIEVIGGVTNGGCMIFANCIAATAADMPVTVSSNTTCRFVNCYYRNGTAWSTTTN